MSAGRARVCYVCEMTLCEWSRVTLGALTKPETSGRQSVLVSPPEYSTIHRYKVWLGVWTWVKEKKGKTSLFLATQEMFFFTSDCKWRSGSSAAHLFPTVLDAGVGVRAWECGRISMTLITSLLRFCFVLPVDLAVCSNQFSSVQFRNVCLL